MTNQPPHNQPPDLLDGLVEQLLICGGVLSQMINHMVESFGDGSTPPDAPEVLEVAHELIHAVIGPVAARHRAADIESASTIIDEVVTEITEEIYFVDNRHSDENGGFDGDGPACRPPRGLGAGPLRDLPRR